MSATPKGFTHVVCTVRRTGKKFKKLLPFRHRGKRSAAAKAKRYNRWRGNLFGMLN